jgi:DNA-binding NarL/FixJ family response regulator
MNAAEPIRVLLADDHRLFREALRALLEPECQIVGEAPDGEQAVEMAARLKPHVVLLDVGMPGTGGLAAAYRLAQSAPAVKVLIVSQYDDEEYVIEALSEAGSAGYLIKDDPGSELLAAVRAVHSGRRYVSPAIAPMVIARLKHPAAADSRGQRLTRREREVLRLIGEGATAKEVAARLGISPKTAQVHRDNLKQKLNLRSTAALVRYAIKKKLIRID